ncbi:uncharacterized protein LOC126747097 [Anthonomus grandis grandis]|uniref:uncharacterized protein LOC126747097 n=1 Tax=Anthonomus grandis grandis TaxID=2921223 RepID=UPI0021652412|nr:uncharacterized protein LOC126747097 [Anthonomus grandis grandis]
MEFTNQEYADIVFTYGRANGNGALARRLYQERYPDRRLPNFRVFQNTFRRLTEVGIGNNPARGVNSGHNNVEIEEQILEAFTANPTASVRKVAEDLGLSRWKVWTTMKKDGQSLSWYGGQGEDPARRIQFCRFLLNIDIEDPLFLRSILWTDESNFSREGITNFHNLHEWAAKDANSHWKKQKSFQNRFSVDMWAEVIVRTIIGPHFLPENLNGANYLDFLQNDIPVLLDEAGLLERERPIIFQQDGCPAHWSFAVRNYLDDCFPDSWIGRGGTFPWPPRSPDLTPLDFFI